MWFQAASCNVQTAPPASCPAAETSGSEDDQLDMPPVQAQNNSDAAEEVECEPVQDPGEFPW